MNTNPYKYTESGYIITWILESIIPKQKSKADEELFIILENNAKDNASSYDIFTSALYKNSEKMACLENLSLID